MMILIADSGSTKTNWCLVEGLNIVKRVQTQGINPFYQTEAEIDDEIQKVVYPNFSGDKMTAIYFYGAGCVVGKKEIIENSLTKHFGVPAEVNSDLLAAARAVCLHEKGIAAILGTGSNSCYYDGRSIQKQVPALGFIIGDEGSGAVLGKKFVGNCYKNQLEPEIKQKFEEKYGLSMFDVLDKIYKQPFPNRFLASLVPFLHENLDYNSIYSLTLESFCEFLNRNIKQYDVNLPIGFVGSVAFYFSDVLNEAAERCGIKIAKIMKDPMTGLIEYHNN